MWNATRLLHRLLFTIGMVTPGGYCLHSPCHVTGLMALHLYCCIQLTRSKPVPHNSALPSVYPCAAIFYVLCKCVTAVKSCTECFVPGQGLIQVILWKVLLCPASTVQPATSMFVLGSMLIDVTC